jgi:hypothetical protein
MAGFRAGIQVMMGHEARLSEGRLSGGRLSGREVDLNVSLQDSVQQSIFSKRPL